VAGGWGGGITTLDKRHVKVRGTLGHGMDSRVNFIY
jgi:hypothetical protein